MEIDIDTYNNLNPKYQLLSYDMNLVKKSVNNLSNDELLSLIPTTNIDKNTLLYTIVNEEQTIGDKITTDNNTVKCSYNINFDTNVGNTLGILVNTSELKLLDVTQLSVEIGFNPLHYIFNGNEEKIDDDILFDYCKKKKYDGYIQLEEGAGNNCYIQFKNDKQSTLCPMVYLINYKNLGIRKTLLLGKIDLYKKNGNKLDIDDIYSLHTLLFCNISNLYEINNDIKVTPIISEGKIILTYNNKDYDINQTYEKNKEYDIVGAYNNKNILNILHLNYINLQDACELEFDYPIIEYQPITKQNVDIYSSNKINTIVSNDLLDKAIRYFSEQNNINAVLMNNYAIIGQIPGYESLISSINNAESLDKLKKIFMRLEEVIVQHINNNYLASPDGYKSTVNFINIQYIKTTYYYVVSKVIAQITSKPIEDIVSIIRNDVYDKKNKIYKFFNVDILLIQIGYDHYYNHKKLYQGLFDDIATYRETPFVKLKFFKLLNKLDDNEYYSNFIQMITNGIYDYYKDFLLGKITLEELEKFMNMKELYDFIFYYAGKYNINSSLLLYYDQIVALPIMQKFTVKNIYTMTAEDFFNDVNRLKLYILITKYVNTLIDYYKLNVDKKDVVTFFTENVEKYLEIVMDEINTNNNVNYYDFLVGNINNDILRYIINMNTNDVMIDYLYTMFNIPMENKNAAKQLVRNKNLYNIFINYLQGNITRNELKNMIYFKGDIISKGKRQDMEEEKSLIEDRRSEEKPKKSRRKKTESDTQSIDEQ